MSKYGTKYWTKVQHEKRNLEKMACDHLATGGGKMGREGRWLKHKRDACLKRKYSKIDSLLAN